MNLLLNRETFTEHSTIGELSVDGTFFCYVLEDVARPIKIKHQTSIPAGRYKITITHSTRFDRELPLLNDVPGFEGIRIHPGNTDKDTSGCLLVGLSRAKDLVGNSREAFNTLLPKLQLAVKRGEEISIEIRGGFDQVEAE